MKIIISQQFDITLLTDGLMSGQYRVDSDGIAMGFFNSPEDAARFLQKEYEDMEVDIVE